MGDIRRRALLAVAVATTVWLAGCAPVETVPGASSTSEPSTSAAGNATTDVDDQALPGGPSAQTSPEATVSGPLGPEDMPDPQLLGEGWRFTVVDGDPHDTGFVSNDAATHERDPNEVAMLAVPFGCEQRDSTTMPAQFALDATYTDGTSAGIAIRLRFSDESQARRFIATRHRDLVACSRQAPAYDGRPTVPTVARVGSATVSERTEPAVDGHWAEIATRAGERDVLLVAIQDMPPGAARAVARDLARG